LDQDESLIMGKFFTKTVASALAILFVAYFMKGVTVDNTITALLVAVVLGLLNNFVKPILVLLTIPFTVFTLGLFLIVINVFIIYTVSELVPGFHVSGFFTAFIFGMLVSFFTSIIESIIGRPQQA
jgi:putative membrane protein